MKQLLCQQFDSSPKHSLWLRLGDSSSTLQKLISLTMCKSFVEGSTRHKSICVESAHRVSTIQHTFFSPCSAFNWKLTRVIKSSSNIIEGEALKFQKLF